MKSAFLMASFMISTCSPKLSLFTSMAVLCCGGRRRKKEEKRRRKNEQKEKEISFS